jgi:hypothetical protein
MFRKLLKTAVGLLVLIIITTPAAIAQNENIVLSGYVKNMQTVIFFQRFLSGSAAGYFCGYGLFG